MKDSNLKAVDAVDRNFDAFEPIKLDRHRVSSMTLVKGGSREARARSPDRSYICHRLPQICDLPASEESLIFIENEASNLFPHCEYQGDTTLIVQGSALKVLDRYGQGKAKIIDLKSPLDNHVTE